MSAKVTVLIVDDDLTNRLVLRAILKETGFEMLEAENGEQAIEIFDRVRIDIVLLDVMMPVMDGYQAAKLIKTRSTRFIPIIFLTALTDEKALARCIEAGGDDFLTKPYNHIILRAKIDALLRINDLYKKISIQNEELNKHNIRIQQEINVAKKVFGNVLNPDIKDSVTGLRYSMSSMSIFNGDMILADRNKTDGMDVLISDFTGHGLSAAIGSIPVADIFYTMTRKGFSFTETLAEINNKLYKLLPTQMFMAAALISIDRENNVVSVVNCGLPDLHMIRGTEIIKELKSQNIPLGIVKQTPDKFDVEMQSIQYEDRILAATDGIMEAENRQGELYGKERILDSVRFAKKPDHLFDKILNDCLEFSKETEQSDDITLLELCHLKHVKYQIKNDVQQMMKPAEWSMQFSLDIDSLRNFDILPYIMQGVNGLQSIPNGRSTVHTILTEIFANALDHGVLGLDSNMKTTPDGYMNFYMEKNQRLETIEEGNIQIILNHETKETGGGRLTIYVCDSGPGFDFSKSQVSMENNEGFSGRGLAMIKHLCTEVKFLGKGNAIMATYEWG
ncbi:MAG: SpoIIE family protein phosphatase [Gammaproteobacteria bacterium]|nr:SpoIIE family protein phosphatase [Gammaproteobacteria bacterium]